VQDFYAVAIGRFLGVLRNYLFSLFDDRSIHKKSIDETRGVVFRGLRPRAPAHLLIHKGRIAFSGAAPHTPAFAKVGFCSARARVANIEDWADL
jgi:hypothetical protein